MKLRTSFFSGAVLKKDIARFFPVWGLYCVYLLTRKLGNQPVYGATAVPVFLYAGICAFTLFSDLFSKRRCNALHALPLRREGWFLTHALAGFLFFFVPTVLFYLVLGELSDVSRQLTWHTIGYTSLEFVFFFGVAVPCVMLAGNHIGAALLYALINYLSPVFEWLVNEMYQPLLYGIPVQEIYADELSPVLYMTENYPGQFEYTCMGPYRVWDQAVWTYFLICGGIGILALLLALVLYRRRALESTGDLISVRWLGPAFVCVLSLMAGVAFFRLVGHSTDEYFMLVPYIALGFFAGRMLLKRRVNVFGLKDFLQLGLVLFILIDTLLLAHWASYGVVKRIPDADDVSSVGVYFTDGKSNYRYEDSLREDYTATSAESIGAIIRTHEALVQLKEDPQDQSLVYLTYHMKNDTKVLRQDMMEKFLDKLNKDYKNSALKLEAADLTNIYAPTFQVFLYSRSSDGTERTEEFILIPSNSFHARPYLSYLYAVGTECPNRTITQETYPFD